MCTRLNAPFSLHSSINGIGVSRRSNVCPNLTNQRFSDNFFQTVGFNFFTHLLYTFLSALDDKLLFNYFQLRRSYAIIIATTKRIFTFHENVNFEACLLSNWRHCLRHVISNMFVYIIIVLFYSDLPQTTINKAINDLRIRLNACVSADGGHFEHRQSRLIWHNFVKVGYNWIKFVI